MRRPLDAFRRLLGLRGLERDVREEMESHIAHRVDALVAEGLDPSEARARAEAEFGDVARLHRETVAARGVGSARAATRDHLDGVRQDLAFAFRQLGRNPAFAAVAVVTIALGIAATTTVASVVRAVVLEPLPFEEPERLVFVEEVTPAKHTFSVSEPTFLDWRDQARVFEGVAAAALRRATMEGDGEPRLVAAYWASASLLPVLGVEPALGRWIAPEEDLPGDRAPVVVLADRFWRETFGSDPRIVGREVVLGGRAHRVIGVLPPDLSFLDAADVVVPLGASNRTDREEHYLDVVARLAAGVSLPQASAGMRELAERLGRIHPEDEGWSVRLTTFRQWLVGDDLTLAGWVLVAGAGLLLVIACVNVSNLLLGRATTRAPEMAVRVALGAGRGRLVRQLFTESLVLAGGGGILGLAAAGGALPVVRSLGAGTIPRLETAALAPGVVAASLAAVVLAALLFGMAPAVAVRRESGAGSPGGATRGGTGRRGVRRALVAGQVALSLVLLVGTGLMARSFQRLAAVDTGFEGRGALAVRLNLRPETNEPDRRAALLREVIREIETVPGVTAAGATAVDPFGGQNLMNTAARADRMPDDAAEFLPIAWRVVTPGFAEAMGVGLVAGRMLEDTDGWDEEGTPVVVSERLVRALWPEARPGDAVGGMLVWGDPSGSRLRIVGVLEDVRDWRIEEEPFPTMYRPHVQIPWGVMTVVVRVEGPAGPRVAPIRAAIRRAAPDLAVPEVRPLTAHVSEAVATPRFHAVLLGVFAGAGLLLAAVGVYGVTAFDVSRRFREIGIRLAVGGSPGEIHRLVLADSMRTALLGAAVGAGVAWAASGLVASLLYGITPADPVTWIGGTLALLAAVLAAAWIPSRRAARVAPREVLTAE